MQFSTHPEVCENQACYWIRMEDKSKGLLAVCKGRLFSALPENVGSYGDPQPLESSLLYRLLGKGRGRTLSSACTTNKVIDLGKHLLNSTYTRTQDQLYLYSHCINLFYLFLSLPPSSWLKSTYFTTTRHAV